MNANRIKTISYGKEKPFCLEDNEGCCSKIAAATSSIRSSWYAPWGGAEETPPLIF